MITLSSQLLNLVERIEEAQRKHVIRHGKRKIITTCPPGKKAQHGRCVTMTAQERQKRRVAARHSLAKRRRKRSQAARSRARSLSLR